MEDDWGQDCTRRAKAALVDTTVANPARVGDYLCGGRDNFEADRRAVRIMRQASAAAAAITPAARAFRQRAVRYLAAEAGIRQFLQIGTGLAASGDTHEVAQSIDPDCRIIYADSDPAVLAHGRALMRSSPAGAVGYVDADVREIGEIVAGARPTLDFGRPVAVLLLATLAFVESATEAATIVSTLLDTMPPGSYVTIYHQASDLDRAFLRAARLWNGLSSRPVTLRSRADIARLVAGLELVPPGLVPICEWRPAPDDPRFEDVVPAYGLVARTP